MDKMKIGYCCGVFDLGHIGHINFLKMAKTYCNILYVGLISDVAIKNLKGKSRPILSFDERKQWIKSLDITKYVVYQKQFNPSNILKNLKPHIFIKGEDQKHISETTAQILEIPIIYLKRTEGISTSEIIKRIKE